MAAFCNSFSFLTSSVIAFSEELNALRSLSSVNTIWPFSTLHAALVLESSAFELDDRGEQSCKQAEKDQNDHTDVSVAETVQQEQFEPVSKRIESGVAFKPAE